MSSDELRSAYKFAKANGPPRDNTASATHALPGQTTFSLNSTGTLDHHPVPVKPSTRRTAFQTKVLKEALSTLRLKGKDMPDPPERKRIQEKLGMYVDTITVQHMSNLRLVKSILSSYFFFL